MEFLIRAEQYVESLADEYWFYHYYRGYREQHSVRESVWLALAQLYDRDTARRLELGHG
jgi:hypothetical protein